MLGVAKSINNVGKTLKKLSFDVLVKRVGRSPGTLIYTGRKEEKEFQIKFTKYDKDFVETKVIENKLELLKQLAELDDDFNYWLDLNYLNDIELLKSIGALFSINSLVLEDILNINHRPKIEFFDEFVFSIIKIINFVDDDKIEFDQLAFLVFDNLIITFHESNEENFAPIYSRLEVSQTVMRKFGTEYMFFAILDYIIDLYSVVNFRLMESLEKLQTIIFENPEKEHLIEIDNLRRRIHETKRFMIPVKDLVNKVLRTEEGFKFVKIKMYFQDALDHMDEINADIDQMVNSGGNLLDLFVSSQGNKMNEVMKVLTVIATIFIPLTFIAGIYGMNFSNMPELNWEFGYFAALFFMLLVGIGFGIYFKIKKWF